MDVMTGGIEVRQLDEIERLDDALIRPGRVDAQYYLGLASKSAAGELFDQFFSSTKIDSNVLTAARTAFLVEVEDYLHSFAKLQGVLMKARDNPEFASEEMQRLVVSAQVPLSIQAPGVELRN